MKAPLFDLRTAVAMAAPVLLAACAAWPEPPPDFAAKNRPLEERCFRLQREAAVSASRPGLTRAEVQAEARAAARRGELDKECDWR